MSHVPEAMDEDLELDPAWLPNLRKTAHDDGLAFLCTPFAEWAVHALAPLVDAWKIGSFEAGHRDLVDLLYPQRRRDAMKPLLISLGMSDDMKRRALVARYPRATFLHCVSQYPTPLTRTALSRCRALNRNGGHTGTWGYSSHSDGWADVIGAVVLGAAIVEKHIQLEDQPPSPDAGPWALPESRFKQMVRECHDVHRSLHTAYHTPEIPHARKLNGA